MRRSGKVILAKLHGLLRPLCYRVARMSLVARSSDADAWVSRELTSRLEAVFSRASLLCEEGRRDPAALESDLCFVVDPIDGSDEFRRGTADFAVSVAVAVDGALTVGVVAYPALGLGFGAAIDAVSGRSALRHSGRRPLRIAVSPRLLCDQMLGRIALQAEAVLVPTVTTTGRARMLLSGLVDVALCPPHDRGTFLWDYAASAVLLEAAGVPFVDFRRRSLTRHPVLVPEHGWIAGVEQAVEPILEAYERLCWV